MTIRWKQWGGLMLALALGGCAYPVRPGGDAGWTVLFDGAAGAPGMQAYTVAYWSGGPQGVTAAASGFDPAVALSLQPYANAQWRIEFNLGTDGEGSVLLRCADAPNLAFADCYRIPLATREIAGRPAVGGVVGMSPPRPVPDLSDGGWHVLDIETVEDRVRVVLDGRRLVDQHDRRRADGRFGLHWGPGTIRFRKVMVRPV